MDINGVISQVINNQTALLPTGLIPFQVVAGAAEYEALRDEVNPKLPALFIIPITDEVEDRVGQNFTRQVVVESIACILMLDNGADRRGQTAVQTVEAYKYFLYKMLYTWRPPDTFSRAPRGFYLKSGGLIQRDFARLEWEIVFSQDVWISTDDGWVIPSVPLDSITIKNTSINPNTDFTDYSNADVAGADLT